MQNFARDSKYVQSKHKTNNLYCFILQGNSQVSSEI